MDNILTNIIASTNLSKVIVTDNIERQKTKVLKVRAFINFEDMKFIIKRASGSYESVSGEYRCLFDNVIYANGIEDVWR